jgi:AcrR family transcriptional regulator
VLATRGFDAVSLSEIAQRAGFTVGAFYARFPDKEALLSALEDRLTIRLLAFIEEATDARPWAGLTIAEALDRYFTGLIDIYATTRGAGRALVLRSHTDAGLRGRLRRLNMEGLPRMLSFLTAQSGITHERPAQAIEVALLTVRSMLRETVLFGETWPGGDAVSPAVLATEMTRLFIGYLGIDPRTPVRLPRLPRLPRLSRPQRTPNGRGALPTSSARVPADPLHGTRSRVRRRRV